MTSLQTCYVTYIIYSGTHFVRLVRMGCLPGMIMSVLSVLLEAVQKDIDIPIVAGFEPVRIQLATS